MYKKFRTLISYKQLRDDKARRTVTTLNEKKKHSKGKRNVSAKNGSVMVYSMFQTVTIWCIMVYIITVDLCTLNILKCEKKNSIFFHKMHTIFRRRGNFIHDHRTIV